MDNAAALFVDAPVEEGHGARAALLTPSGPVTYARLQGLTDRAAHGLRARGVEPEHRVAMLLPDGPAWAATFFAALKLGAVAVPLNTRLAAADLRTVLADCRPKAVVADRAVLEAGGTSIANVVRVGVYLRNMDDFPVFNRVFKEYFQGVQPARTTVEAAPPRRAATSKSTQSPTCPSAIHTLSLLGGRGQGEGGALASAPHPGPLPRGERGSGGVL